LLACSQVPPYDCEKEKKDQGGHEGEEKRKLLTFEHGLTKVQSHIVEAAAEAP
jgi:hypothetical protein